MALVNWYYPKLEEKIAPKATKCSGCPKVIPPGGRYYRHNHG